MKGKATGSLFGREVGESVRGEVQQPSDCYLAHHLCWVGKSCYKVRNGRGGIGAEPQEAGHGCETDTLVAVRHCLAYHRQGRGSDVRERIERPKSSAGWVRNGCEVGECWYGKSGVCSGKVEGVKCLAHTDIIPLPEDVIFREPGLADELGQFLCQSHPRGGVERNPADQSGRGASRDDADGLARLPGFLPVIACHNPLLKCPTFVAGLVIAEQQRSCGQERSYDKNECRSCGHVLSVPSPR